MQESSAPEVLILHIREALQRGCMWAEPYGRWQLLPGWHSGAAAAPDASHSLTLCSSAEFPAGFEVLSPSAHPRREDPPAARRGAGRYFGRSRFAPGSSRLELLRDEAPGGAVQLQPSGTCRWLCPGWGSGAWGTALGTWDVWMEETNGMLAPGHVQQLHSHLWEHLHAALGTAGPQDSPDPKPTVGTATPGALHPSWSPK